MDVVFWICGAAALIAILAYGAIAACLLAAKYRMTHVPPQREARAAPVADLRYRTH